MEKVNTSLTEHEDKANKIFKEFVNIKSNNLNNDGENLTNQANAEIQQIVVSVETKNIAILAQKQAELSAIPLVRVQTGPNSYLDTNEAAAAQKQAEYETLIAQYKSQCESQIANIKAKHETQVNQKTQSFESDMLNKANIFKQQKKDYVEGLISKLNEVKDKLSKGENVDIDNIINGIDAASSLSLSNIQYTVNQASTIAYAVLNVIYDNPILNHQELMKQMSQNFGASIIDKLINFGMQFTNNQENKNMLNNILAEQQDNIEAISIAYWIRCRQE